MRTATRVGEVVTTARARRENPGENMMTVGEGGGSVRLSFGRRSARRARPRRSLGGAASQSSQTGGGTSRLHARIDCLLAVVRQRIRLALSIVIAPLQRASRRHSTLCEAAYDLPFRSPCTIGRCTKQNASKASHILLIPISPWPKPLRRRLTSSFAKAPLFRRHTHCQAPSSIGPRWR